MSQISFREIVKLVHPDTNPHVTDPSSKMSEVIKWKDNPAKLFELAVKWKLIETPQKEQKLKKKRKYPLAVGYWVIYTKKGKTGYGIIVDIKTYPDGPKKGWKKIFIVDSETGLIIAAVQNVAKESNIIQIHERDIKRREWIWAQNCYDFYNAEIAKSRKWYRK